MGLQVPPGTSVKSSKTIFENGIAVVFLTGLGDGDVVPGEAFLVVGGVGRGKIFAVKGEAVLLKNIIFLFAISILHMKRTKQFTWQSGQTLYWMHLYPASPRMQMEYLV